MFGRFLRRSGPTRLFVVHLSTSRSPVTAPFSDAPPGVVGTIVDNDPFGEPNMSIFKIIKAYRPHLWRVVFNLGDLNSNVQPQNCVNIVNMFRDHELLHPNISKLAG